MTNRLLLALESIVSWLDKQRVPYMIFGGIANSIYGSPRQTFDIDIKISVPAENDKTDFIEQLRTVAVLLPENPIQFIAETSVLPVTIGSVRIDLVFAQLPHSKNRQSREARLNGFSLFQ